MLLLLLCASVSSLRAQSPAFAFAEANKLYEQGKFAAAAAAYDQLLQSNRPSATVCFNLGNAWFKAGQNGRALAAYRQAHWLAPRDPNVRFNLQFVRKRVTGGDAPAVALWSRALGVLTLNEWMVLTAIALWLWCALLALREANVEWRRALAGYTGLAGLLTVALGASAALALYERSAITAAVVVVPNAVVRNGPLEDSPVAYQLRDGSEMTVLDQIEVSDKAATPAVGNKQTWLQVQSTGHRVGWLKRDQVMVLKF